MNDDALALLFFAVLICAFAFTAFLLHKINPDE